MAIKIEGYLVQSKLEDALKSIVGIKWIGREIKVPGTRKRWDMEFVRNGQTSVVEFDGDRHYRDSLTIKADRKKDAIAKQLGYKTIRIPYWVQLTDETFLYYFCFQENIIQDFPHGFIKSKIFPASYCEMGIERFNNELNNLPKNTKNYVISSLNDRANEFDIEYVLPANLRNLIHLVQFKQYIVISKLMKIAEKLWPIFNEMQVEEDKTVGISEFEISINDKNKDHFNITKIDINGRANFYTDKRLSVIDLTVGNAGNLVHELSHVVYKYNENQNEDYRILAEYIHKILNDDKKSVIDYLNRDNISNYDKLIGYLCLADDDELTAKLAGFYIPHLLQGRELEEGDYYPKLKPIYNDMKIFDCSQNEIAEIIETDKVKGLLSKHLNKSINSDTIRSLIKEIKDQGAKFVNIYEGLLKEQ